MLNTLIRILNATLTKSLMKLRVERPCDWDVYLPELFFALCEVPQDLTIFSPFKFLYSRTVMGRTSVLLEFWTESGLAESVKSMYQHS